MRSHATRRRRDIASLLCSATTVTHEEVSARWRNVSRRTPRMLKTSNGTVHFVTVKALVGQHTPEAAPAAVEQANLNAVIF